MPDDDENVAKTRVQLRVASGCFFYVQLFMKFGKETRV
jgi:hypothetical protein